MPARRVDKRGSRSAARSGLNADASKQASKNTSRKRRGEILTSLASVEAEKRSVAAPTVAAGVGGTVEAAAAAAAETEVAVKAMVGGMVESVGAAVAAEAVTVVGANRGGAPLEDDTRDRGLEERHRWAATRSILTPDPCGISRFTLTSWARPRSNGNVSVDL